MAPRGRMDGVEIRRSSASARGMKESNSSSASASKMSFGWMVFLPASATRLFALVELKVSRGRAAQGGRGRVLTLL